MDENKKNRFITFSKYAAAVILPILVAFIITVINILITKLF